MRDPPGTVGAVPGTIVMLVDDPEPDPESPPPDVVVLPDPVDVVVEAVDGEVVVDVEVVVA